jgi:hypothetical protein
MKRTFLGLLVSVAMTGTMVAAQDGRVPSPGQSQPSPVDQSQPSPRDPAVAPSSSSATETTVTGCLVQGSGPTVFLLQDAKPSAAAVSSVTSRDSAAVAGSSNDAAGASVSASASSSMLDRGTTYRLDMSSGAKDLNFKTHLNQQVTVTGKLDSKAATTAAAAGAVDKIDEKSLAKFSATTVTKIADTCSAVG